MIANGSLLWRKHADLVADYERLMALHPDTFFVAVNTSWAEPTPLFSYLSRDGKPMAGCGCLTQVKVGGSIRAWNDDITESIKQDDRIPFISSHITKEMLVAFAEWQGVSRELAAAEAASQV